MKILFFANRIPYPPYRGDKLKIYNLAKRLSRQHELHLLTFTQTEDDNHYRKELEKIFHSVHLVHLPKWRSALNCLRGLWNPLPFQVLYFASKEMQKKLRQVLMRENFDAIHVQHLRMAPYLAKQKNLPRILDLPDAFSLYWERRKKIPKNFLLHIFENIEQKRLLRYEAVIREYDLALTCSEEDLEYLQHQHQTNNLKLLPNGVDLETFSSSAHDYSKNDTLLFTGNMDYAPNVDAVCWFAKEILPLVSARFPKVKFVVAGQRPVAKLRALANDQIIITGFVQDIAACYRDASVVVAPLRFGAGTQNKVLEALAMGVPVVCTDIGFKGLGVADGEGVLMRTEKKAFADAVCELLESETFKAELGKKGKEIVRRKFDWDVIAKQLEHYLQEIIS